MLFLKREPKKLSLIINVDSFFIEGAIYNREEQNFLKAAEILGTADLTQGDINLNFSKNLENKLKRSFRQIIEKTNSLKKRIDYCFIVFSSPWLISRTHFVKIKRDKPFLASKEEFDKILKDETAPFAKEIKSRFSAEYLKFIETDVMKFFLNGYETVSPFGGSAKSLDLCLYLSAIKNSLFEFISELTKISLGLTPEFLLIKSRSAVFFQVLKDFLAFDKGAIFVDIGRDMTDILLIKNNYIEETVTLSRGYNIFVRRLMNALNLSHNEAESLFERHQKNLLEQSFQQKISDVLKEARKEMLDYFHKALKELSADHFLPQNLFLFSTKPVSKEFFFGDFKDLKEDFSIQEVSLKPLANYLKAPEEILKTYNPFLLVEIAFFKKIRSERSEQM